LEWRDLECEVVPVHLGDPLPFTANGVTYSAFRNAFYVWQWDCKDVVLPNAIMRFGYDYRK